MSEKWEKIFNKTATELFELLDSEEVLTLNFSGEETNFVRLNNGFVRQATNVEQGKITLELVRGKKKASLTSSLSLDFEESLAKLKEDLNSLNVQKGFDGIARAYGVSFEDASEIFQEALGQDEQNKINNGLADDPFNKFVIDLLYKISLLLSCEKRRRRGVWLCPLVLCHLVTPGRSSLEC